MKNKKGFTLIELLAVIIILAIIALIAVPIVLNMIEKARKSAARSSTLGYVDAIEHYASFGLIKNDAELTGYDVPLPTMTNNSITCNKTTSGWNSECSAFFTAVDTKAKGERPTTATIVISSTGKVLSGTTMKFGKYSVNYDGKDAYIGDNSNTPSEPTTNDITISEDSMLTTITNGDHIWSVVEGDVVNAGLWQIDTPVNTYYADKITVTSSKPATITGKVALWSNKYNAYNAKYRIGFSTTNDNDKESFTEYQELDQNFTNTTSNSYRLSPQYYTPYEQEFEVTIDTPGEYYIKGVYYMTTLSYSAYARLYDLEITQ